jgi:hypothetical protein
MARIWDEWLDSVIYLYTSVDAANKGVKSGGCGFIVGVKSESDPSFRHLYAVTNAHVVESGATVIRFNTTDGDTDTLGLDKGDWRIHPDGDDIAVAPIDVPRDVYRMNVIDREMCRAVHTINGLGPGDEVFMLGRFIAHDGLQTNKPVARFGNIAMSISDVKSQRGSVVPAWLVESRSLAGMSGSPVFWFIPKQQEWPRKVPVSDPVFASFFRGPMLLGIDFGHPPHYDPVVDKTKRAERHPEGWRVQSNSGFMTVAPIERLTAMLDSEEFAIERREIDAIRLHLDGENPPLTAQS